MGLFHHKKEEVDTYEQVYEAKEHEGHKSHEVIGGAAAYFAVRAYQKKKEKEGKPVSHAKAKEIAAALAAAEIEKLFETKGLTALDKAKAKRHAQEEAEKMVDRDFN